jgi:hypothetical protein
MSKMESVQYFNNFVSSFYKEDLQSAIFSTEYAWVHHDETAGGYNGNFAWVADSNTEETSLFAHKPDKSSKDIISYEPLIYRLQEVVGHRIHVDRLKTNLMLPTTKKNLSSYNRPHIDHTVPYARTLLYYVNDSDGDTVLFDKTYTGSDPGELTVLHRFTPKAGDAILFDSFRYHASSAPTINKRSVINIIFWAVREQISNQPEDTPFAPLPEMFTSVDDIKRFFPGP